MARAQALPVTAPTRLAKDTKVHPPPITMATPLTARWISSSPLAGLAMPAGCYAVPPARAALRSVLFGLLVVVLGVLAGLGALGVVLGRLVQRADRGERDDQRVTLAAHLVVGHTILEGDGQLRARRVVGHLDGGDA